MSNHASIIRLQEGNKPVISRGRNFIELDLGGGQRKVVATIDPLHYGVSENLEIDTGWEADTGAWQWRNIKNDHLIHSRDLFNSGNLLEWRVGNEWVIIDPQSINWINQDTSRQQIAIKQSVSAISNDDWLVWANAYKPGVHYEFFAHPKRLIKHIIIDNLTDLPSPTVSGTIWFEAEFSISNSPGVELYLDGIVWERTNGVRVQTSNRIEFRDTNGVAQWYADSPVATDFNGNKIQAQYEVHRQGANYFIRVRVPRDWMLTAVYPISIDPTFTDGYGGDVTSAYDSMTYQPAPGDNWGNYTSILMENFATEYMRGLIKFDLSSLSGATITSANLYLYNLTDTQSSKSFGVNAILSANSGWTELGSCHDYAVGTTRWAGDTGNDGGSDAGCGVSGTDFNGTALGSWTTGEADAVGTEYNISLTVSQVQAWLTANYGLVARMITASGSANEVASSDHATTGYRPKLVIVYTTGDELIATDITTPAAILDAPTLGQTHVLSATDITTPAAILDAPTLDASDAVDLVATDITTVQVILGRPLLGPNSLLLYPQSAITAAESPWLDNDWTTPSNITADDAATANITAATYDSPDQSYVLKGYNFNLSALPVGSTIVGIICRINCWYAAGTNSLDLCQLLDISRAKVGTNKAATPIPLTTLNTNIVTLGANNDLWGNALTEAWVKDIDFGIALGFAATGANSDVFVDYVTLEVFYVPPVPEELIANDILSGIPILDAPSLGTVYSLTANDITTEAPILDAPTLGQTHVLSSADVTTESAVLDQPTLGQTYALTANDIITEPPILDAPNIGMIHALSATDITTEPAVLDAPNLGQTHVLVSIDITTEPVVLDQPTLGQIHSLTAIDISTEAPILDSPTLGQTHSLTANDITTEAPILGSPSLAVTDELTATDITTEPAVLDAPTFGQTHVLTSNDITTEPPVLDAPTLTQTYELTATDITTEPAVLDAPSLTSGFTHDLTATDITTEPPILDAPNVGQKHALTANEILSGIPVLESPTIGQTHNLASNDTLAGIPVLESPTMGQTHILVSNEILSGIPILGAPSITEVLPDELTATDITSGIPILGAPNIGQKHNLSSTDITSGIPVLETPTLGQTHSLIANSILSGIPLLDFPSIGQTHYLTANDILSGIPILGAPLLTLELPVIPDNRKYKILAEDRTIKIESENRKIEVLEESRSVPID